MINIFQEKFNFTYNYFSTLLELVMKNERKFPQALIFEGSDTVIQYIFTLELARKLNCQKDGSINCDCLNCRWIRSHSHPAVQNVSEIHFKGENDETKTVISSKQAREIENSLALSSDFHRFFIFFSSKQRAYENNELAVFDDFNYSKDIDFELSPLTYSTFHPTTPNALLKSIEEPPTRTTFVFLTKSKEDILPTIVSRCQTFKLSGDRCINNYSSQVNLFNQYLSLNFDNCLDLSDAFLTVIKDSGLTLVELLDNFLEFLLGILKQNTDNSQLIAKINNDIKLVNHAQKQSKANMSDKIVLESLMLQLARGY